MGGKPWYERPFNTSKGQFSMTLVTDGVYVEHSWGQNSGHIGISKEAIPKFIKFLSAFAPEMPVAKDKPAAKGKAETAGVSSKGKGIAKKEKVKAAKEAKEGAGEQKEGGKKKKEPEVKKTVEELDAELLSYQSERSGAAVEAA